MIDIGLIVGAAILLAISAVLVYTLSTLRDWISNKIGNFRNRQIITGAVRERLEMGDYKIYPFVFDEAEDRVLETANIETKAIDEELEEKFNGRDEVLLTVEH